jgi:hypothetical protein
MVHGAVNSVFLIKWLLSLMVKIDMKIVLRDENEELMNLF